MNFICIYPPPGSLSFGEGRDYTGKLWRWEFSEQFGPIFLKQNGDPLKNQPISEKHPAWAPFEEWHKARNVTQKG